MSIQEKTEIVATIEASKETTIKVTNKMLYTFIIGTVTVVGTMITCSLGLGAKAQKVLDSLDHIEKRQDKIELRQDRVEAIAMGGTLKAN